jgi:diacylglycerol kinase family enzyme
VKSLANGRRTPCRITVDGELWHEGELLLASLANGRYIGGGYKCAPRSLNNDGLLEVAKMKPISLLRFAKSIGYYKRGEHLDSMSLKDVVDYRRGRTAVVECDHKFHIGIDGELLSGTRFEIENLPRAIRFAVPNS